MTQNYCYYIDGKTEANYQYDLLDKKIISKASRILNKNQPKKDYYGKDPLKRTIYPNFTPLNEPYEKLSSDFLRSNALLRWAQNSRYVFDARVQNKEVNQFEFFCKSSYQEIIAKCKPEFKELFNIIKHDKVLYKVFLKKSKVGATSKLLKFISIILYNFSEATQGVLRMPRRHAYWKNSEIGFSETFVNIGLSYLIARGIIYTTAGRRYNDKDSEGYYIEGTAYIPSFILMTDRGIELLKEMIKIYDSKPKGVNCYRVRNNAKVDYAPATQNDFYSKKHPVGYFMLWKNEQSACNIADELGLGGDTYGSVRKFYYYCKNIITNCRFDYLKSIKSICYHINEFFEDNHGFFIPKGSIAKFVKYIMFGQWETPCTNFLLVHKILPSS